MARLSNSRRGVTFILSAAVLAASFAAPTVYASADVAGNEAAHLAHARHHGRMIRKRSPLFGFGDGLGGDHSTTTATSSVEASTPLASPTTTTTSSVASTTSSGDFWDTLTSLIADPFPTTSTSSSTPTSSSVSTSSFSLNATTTLTSSLAANTTTSTTSTTLSTTSTTPIQEKPSSSTPNGPGKTSTVIVAASGTSASAKESQTGTTSAAATQGVAVARKTIVVLVALAGSIGLAFLIWTGIRKWKFRPSSRFEDRMQDPINWQPNNVAYDTTDPAHRIEAHRRNGSTGSHGSFGSSEMAHNNTVQPMQYTGYGATGVASTGMTRSLSGRTTSSAHHSNEALPPLPPHDFTAGAGGSDSYTFYHNQQQPHVIGGTAASPPQMVENGLTRGGQPRPISMRSDNPYDGLDDDYDQRPTLPPHHGGAYHTGY